MNSITLGDPATQAGTPFTLVMPDSRGGTISIINESAYGLDFTIQNATFRVPADTKRDISVRGQISQQGNWRIANNTNAAVAPISDVVVECYGLDECPVSNIQPLMRQTNVGNTQPVSTNVSQVLNDGNTAPYLVIEATPSGATGSQLKWNNDGSGLFGGGKASVDNAGILTLPAGAVPVASISAGNLPATTKVPVANLNAGVLPSGVSLATLSSDGGALTSDGAGNLTTKSLKTASLLAATAVAHFFIETLQSGVTALGIAFTTWTGSASATPFSIGGQIGGAPAYVDNSGNLRGPSVGGVGAAAFTVTANGHNTIFNADGTISVSPKTFSGSMMMAGSAGGGNPGVLNWFGTTDPGSAASEGDMWLPA